MLRFTWPFHYLSICSLFSDCFVTWGLEPIVPEPRSHFLLPRPARRRAAGEPRSDRSRVSLCPARGFARPEVFDIFTPVEATPVISTPLEATLATPVETEVPDGIGKAARARARVDTVRQDVMLRDAS